MRTLLRKAASAVAQSPPSPEAGAAAQAHTPWADAKLLAWRWPCEPVGAHAPPGPAIVVPDAGLVLLSPPGQPSSWGSAHLGPTTVRPQPHQQAWCVRLSALHIKLSGQGGEPTGATGLTGEAERNWHLELKAQSDAAPLMLLLNWLNRAGPATAPTPALPRVADSANGAVGSADLEALLHQLRDTQQSQQPGLLQALPAMQAHECRAKQLQLHTVLRAQFGLSCSALTWGDDGALAHPLEQNALALLPPPSTHGTTHGTAPDRLQSLPASAKQWQQANVTDRAAQRRLLTLIEAQLALHPHAPAPAQPGMPASQAQQSRAHVRQCLLRLRALAQQSWPVLGPPASGHWPQELAWAQALDALAAMPASGAAQAKAHPNVAGHTPYEMAQHLLALQAFEQALQTALDQRLRPTRPNL